MRILIIAVCCLCVAFANHPNYNIQVPRASNAGVVKVVGWVAEAKMGPNAWLLRLSSDAGCTRCSILKDPKLKMWPATCNPCVQPFWNHMKNVKGCEKCRRKNKDCKKCQKHLRKMEGPLVTRRNQLAQPYLRKIQFI